MNNKETAVNHEISVDQTSYIEMRLIDTLPKHYFYMKELWKDKELRLQPLNTK